MRSGIDARVGIATETRYGTSVTPVTFLPFTSEGLELEPNFIRTAGLRAGQIGQSEAQHVQTTRSVAGPLVMDVLTKGMGKLFNLLNADANAPRAPGGAVTARQFTFAVGRTDPFGKSLTLQVGRPDVNNTVQPFTYLGVKVTQVQVAMEKGGVLVATWTLDAKDEDTGIALATPTYVSGAIPFNFQGASIEVDDVLLRDIVESATITIPIPQKTDRFGIGSGATKAEPIQNGLTVPTIALRTEFSSLAQHTAFKNATRRKIELLNTGPIIEAAIAFACNFTMPKTVAISSGPKVEGPDVITQDITLECLDDGTSAPLTIDYITTDTAL